MLPYWRPSSPVNPSTQIPRSSATSRAVYVIMFNVSLGIWAFQLPLAAFKGYVVSEKAGMCRMVDFGYIRQKPTSSCEVWQKLLGHVSWRILIGCCNNRTSFVSLLWFSGELLCRSQLCEMCERFPGKDFVIEIEPPPRVIWKLLLGCARSCWSSQLFAG